MESEIAARVVVAVEGTRYRDADSEELDKLIGGLGSRQRSANLNWRRPRRSDRPSRLTEPDSEVHNLGAGDPGR